MDVAIALPNAVPGADGAQLTEWARRAERRGFSSLAANDRFAYASYEPLTALTLAAGVTERIGLCTAIAVVPLRDNAMVLAKQALSLQALSGERLTLGVGLGSRESDYAAAGIPFAERGRKLEQELVRIRDAWADGQIGPAVAPPSLVVGGGVDASFDRAARLGDGWIAGGIDAAQFAAGAAEVGDSWARHGRAGRPRLIGLIYFSLGPEAEAVAASYLTSYYAWLGVDTATAIASAAATDADEVQAELAAFEAAGCDELILFPCAADPAQVDLLAEAAKLKDVGSRGR